MLNMLLNFQSASLYVPWSWDSSAIKARAEFQKQDTKAA